MKFDEPVCDEVKRETVKELLDSMSAILFELNSELRMISDAVYRGCIHDKNDELPNTQEMPPMVSIMREHRDAAQKALDEVLRIREVLW